MTELYNFLGSWQLFPERGTYGWGARPKSAIYRLLAEEDPRALVVEQAWVTLEDQALQSKIRVPVSEGLHAIESNPWGEAARFVPGSSLKCTLEFLKSEHVTLRVVHEITPQGYLQVTQQRLDEGEPAREIVEVYHKQLRVLPYAASVSGAVIKPTEAGMIRHSALTAMEEQTNMQLAQIRQQIELLAMQAKEIMHRKELSMMIYQAELGFQPVIGKTYYLYEKENGSFLLSMVAPQEWGKKLPYKKWVAAVQLLADHTWKELT